MDTLALRKVTNWNTLHEGDFVVAAVPGDMHFDATQFSGFVIAVVNAYSPEGDSLTLHMTNPVTGIVDANLTPDTCTLYSYNAFGE